MQAIEPPPPGVTPPRAASGDMATQSMTSPTITPPATILLKHHDAITAARLAKWTNAGLRVYAWADITADPETEWERIADYGNDNVPGQVSGYITGFPAGYQAWKASRVC